MKTRLRRRLLVMESNLRETKEMGSKWRSSPKELRINSQHSSGKSMEMTSSYSKEGKDDSIRKILTDGLGVQKSTARMW